MPQPQIADTLAAWAVLMMRCEAQLAAITTLMDADTESPFLRPFCDLMQAHTRDTAAAVGDRHGWLEWYWVENDLGARGHSAGPVGHPRPITCADDLAWLIAGQDGAA